MGNLYNVEQKFNPAALRNTWDGSAVGLAEWKKSIRKEIMEKLKGYSPHQVDAIIKTTFGDYGSISQ